MRMIFNKQHSRLIFLLIYILLSISCGTPEKLTKKKPTPTDKLSPVSQVPKAETKKVIPGSPDDPNSRIYLGTDGKLAGRGTADQPASVVFRIGQGIHPKALSMPNLPKDKFGLVDWAAMVKQGLITPAESLKGNQQEPPLLELDVLIKTKGDFVNDVMFQHKPHVYWLSCQNCHPRIFTMAKGQNKMSMQGIVKGKWCGQCHGKISFPLTDCKRCHSQAKK